MPTLTAYPTSNSLISGTAWAAQTSAYGAPDAAVATWTSSTSSATSVAEFGTYDFSAIPAGATINSVTVGVTQGCNNTARLLAPQYQVMLAGATSGSLQTGTLQTALTLNTFAAVTFTLAQLQTANNVRVRVTARHAANSQSGIQNLDAIAITVDYTVPAGPTVSVTETAWTQATTPLSVVIPGCLAGDWLAIVAGGDQSSSNQVSAVTASTTAGTTGAWAELVENLTLGSGLDWFFAAKAQVSADGSVTVQVARTKAGSTGGFWGFYVIRGRNCGGVNLAGILTAGNTTQVISCTVAQDSAVAIGLFDWTVVTAPTAWTPSGQTVIESQATTHNTVAAAYWTAQASGTRNYGTTNFGAGAKITGVAVELLKAGATVVNLGQLIETETPLAVNEVKQVKPGQLVETETVQAVTVVAGGGAITPPTFVADYEGKSANWISDTTPATTPGFNGALGDVLVSLAGQANWVSATPTNMAWSSSPAETWTERAETASANDTDAWAQAATAILSAARTGMTVSVARTAGALFPWNHTVAHFTDSDGIGNTGQNAALVATSGVTWNVTTTYDNSDIVAIFVDWNASMNAARTYRSVNGAAGIELTYYDDTANYSVLVARWHDVGAAGSKTIGITSPTGGTFVGAFVEVRGKAGAAGPTIVNVGQLVEAEGLLGAAPRKLAQPGQLIESEALQAAAPRTLVKPGQLIETEALQTPTAGKLARPGQLSETEAPLAVALRRLVKPGQLAETEAPLVATLRRLARPGQVVETETVWSLFVAIPQVHNLGQLIEAEALLGATARRLIRPGQLTESETTLAALARKTVRPGLLAETEAAQAATARKLANVSQLTEVEGLLTASPRKTARPGQLSETEQAMAATARKLALPGQLGESEGPLSAALRRLVRPGQVGEAEGPFGVTARKTVRPGLLGEVETIWPVTVGGLTYINLAQLLEVEGPLGVTVRKLVRPLIVSESEAALHPTALRLIRPGLLTETEALLFTTVVKRARPAQLVEVELVLNVSTGTTVQINLGRVFEVEALLPAKAVKLIRPGQLGEVEDVLATTARKLARTTQLLETEGPLGVRPTRLLKPGLITETELVRAVTLREIAYLGLLVEVEEILAAVGQGAEARVLAGTLTGPRLVGVFTEGRLVGTFVLGHLAGDFTDADLAGTFTEHRLQGRID